MTSIKYNYRIVWEKILYQSTKQIVEEISSVEIIEDENPVPL